MILSKSLSYYIIGYTIVTIIASLHFLFNWKVRGQEGFDTSKGIQALKTNATGLGAFKNTKPFHPIYNIVVFPIAGVAMFKQLASTPSLIEVIEIGALWIAYSLILDVVFWVVLPHPWRLTIKEFFIDYQPWITLAYVAIFISPIISNLFY